MWASPSATICWIVSNAAIALRRQLPIHGNLDERHDHLENEQVVSQTARQHEEVKQLMGPEDPGPEGGPVQQVEHRPHAIGQAANDNWHQCTVSHDLRNLGITDYGAPPHRQVNAGGQHG